MFQSRLTKRDIMAMAAVLLCAVLLLTFPLFRRTQGEVLIVTSTQTGTQEYLLSQDASFSVTAGGHFMIVVIRNGEAYVAESSCRDGVCLNSRPISKTGESILCAPAGIRLTVKGGAGNVDFVAG